MEFHYTICYINRHGLLTVSDHSPGIVRAVSCEMENIVWELTGRVDGVECNPHGMLYSPYHDALLVADGINCRILVLNPQDGSVTQVVPLSEVTSIVWDFSLHGKQILVHHQHKNMNHSVSYFSLE